MYALLRGQLSLPLTYWVFGVGGNMSFVAALLGVWSAAELPYEGSTSPLWRGSFGSSSASGARPEAIVAGGSGRCWREGASALGSSAWLAKRS
jgi:hypothetical protein